MQDKKKTRRSVSAWQNKRRRLSVCTTANNYDLGVFMVARMQTQQGTCDEGTF